MCEWSENPPAEFACPPRVEGPIKPKRAVTIDIQLDRFPKETGWMIRSQYGKTNAYIGIGAYSTKSTGDKHVVTTIQLEEDTNYDFIVLDAYGDGLKFDGGYYKVWMGNAPYLGIQMVAGNTFGKYVSHPFYLPKNIAPPPTPVSPPGGTVPTPAGPVPSPAGPVPTPGGPVPTPGQDPSATVPTPNGKGTYLTLGIKFDRFPEEIGWAITSVETQELLMSRSFGSYKGKQNSMVVETIPLPEGSSKGGDQFIFAILDSGRDGLCCSNTKGQGFFQVFYGDIADNQVMFRGGSFKYLQQFIFTFNGGVITSPPIEQRSDEEDKRDPAVPQRDPQVDTSPDDVASGGSLLNHHHMISAMIAIAVFLALVS